MVCKEIIHVYLENHTKPISMLSEQSAKADSGIYFDLTEFQYERKYYNCEVLQSVL